VSEALTIRSVEALLVVVPMRRALGTSAVGIAEAPLVLIDLQTEQGVTGRAYLFCYLEAAATRRSPWPATSAPRWRARPPLPPPSDGSSRRDSSSLGPVA
jgi:hypothetical protein